MKSARRRPFARVPPRPLTLLSSSSLPTRHGIFSIHVFQDAQGPVEHIALIMGNVQEADDVIVRVHSECLTGDVFQSARCDCGEQLEKAMAMIAANGHGMVIYLRGHEGRGIGIANKVRAYAFQDDGHDTVSANLALGLPVDNRSFEAAAAITEHFGIRSVRLMTNNPEKLAQLKAHGVRISSRLAIQTSPNHFNKNYLLTKALRLGHMLALPIQPMPEKHDRPENFSHPNMSAIP